jgi:hypothetical protein
MSRNKTKNHRRKRKLKTAIRRSKAKILRIYSDMIRFRQNKPPDNLIKLVNFVQREDPKFENEILEQIKTMEIIYS